MRIQTLDGDFVKTGVAMFTYTVVSFVLYGSSVGLDFARLSSYAVVRRDGDGPNRYEYDGNAIRLRFCRA